MIAFWYIKPEEKTSWFNHTGTFASQIVLFFYKQRSAGILLQSPPLELAAVQRQYQRSGSGGNVHIIDISNNTRNYL